MPKIKRKEGRQGELSPLRKGYLCDGQYWAPFLDGEPFKSEAEARAAWREHREEIMRWNPRGPSFTAIGPGARPWAWWHFEKHPPRLREKITGGYVGRHENVARRSMGP